MEKNLDCFWVGGKSFIEEETWGKLYGQNRLKKSLII